jgi:uncharacterized LabA/DUF88 family protein
VTLPSRAIGQPLRTGLFVDFDNIYIPLRESSPRAAEVFAQRPELWLDWLTRVDTETGEPDEHVRRRLLTCNCYLNPVIDSKGFRAFFARAGFRVVDCPSLTQQNKSSADIHMVMDMIDLLAHPVRYDEVIVMSADADFTAVMLRLRSHDRRTVCVTSGPSAQAFRSACDLVIGEEVFTTHLLRLQKDAAEAAHPTAAVDSGTDALLAAMGRQVVELVARSNAPVPGAALAQALIKRHGREATLGSQWLGYGSFADLLRNLDLTVDHDHTLTLDFTNPGFVYDTRKHSAPEAPTSPVAGLDPVLRQFIENVSSVTGYPPLAPEAYRELFRQVFREIADRDADRQQRPLDQGAAAAAIAQRCGEAGHPVEARQVLFILRGYTFSGYWRDGPRAGSPTELALATFASAQSRCANFGIPATEDNRRLLRRWLLGTDQPENVASEPVPAS